MNLYVGNLSYSLSREELTEAFAAFGPVKSTHIVTDRDTGRPKGFAFVEMENAEDGQKAIDGLNGAPLSGRPIKVNEAKPREFNKRPSSGGPRNNNRPNRRTAF